MILDANIVIYAANSPAPELDGFITPHGVAVPSVVKIEVYGYPRLGEVERMSLDVLFRGWTVLPLDEVVVAKTIELRQKRKMGLGDAIIAATALVHQMPLVTRNVEDFDHIAGLQLVNPFANHP
jgi:toxin FitB